MPVQGQSCPVSWLRKARADSVVRREGGRRAGRRWSGAEVCGGRGVGGGAGPCRGWKIVTSEMNFEEKWKSVCPWRPGGLACGAMLADPLPSPTVPPPLHSFPPKRGAAERRGRGTKAGVSADCSATGAFIRTGLIYLSNISKYIPGVFQPSQGSVVFRDAAVCLRASTPGVRFARLIVQSRLYTRTPGPLFCTAGHSHKCNDLLSFAKSNPSVLSRSIKVFFFFSWKTLMPAFPLFVLWIYISRYGPAGNGALILSGRPCCGMYFSLPPLCRWQVPHPFPAAWGGLAESLPSPDGKQVGLTPTCKLWLMYRHPSGTSAPRCTPCPPSCPVSLWGGGG